jgi:hypothetical protein
MNKKGRMLLKVDVHQTLDYKILGDGNSGRGDPSKCASTRKEKLTFLWTSSKSWAMIFPFTSTGGENEY